MTREPTPGCTGDGCEQALEQLEAYLDGELPEARLEDIEAHLTECYPCTDRADFEGRLRAIVRNRCVDAPPERLIARIRERLDVAGGTDRAEPAG